MPGKWSRGALISTVANQQLFRKADNKAQMVIGTTVGPTQVNHIKHCTTARQMWDALVDVHEQKTDAEKGRLNSMFWSFKIKNGEAIADAISRLNDIVMRLQNLDEKVTENTKIFRLIDALPAEYLSFSAAWNSTAASEKTFSNLRQRLITEEQRHGNGQGTAPSESKALIVSQRISQKCFCACNCGERPAAKSFPLDIKTKTKKVIWCYSCKKEGHIKKDCPNKQRSHQSDALACTSDGAKLPEWTLDSGATEHMSPNRAYFKNHKEFPIKRRVEVASGDLLMAHGEGDIEVMAFDGSCWRRRTLMESLYVPDLKFNLFSLSRVLDRGCRIVGDKDSCSFTRGDCCSRNTKRATLSYAIRISSARFCCSGGKSTTFADGLASTVWPPELQAGRKCPQEMWSSFRRREGSVRVVCERKGTSDSFSEADQYDYKYWRIGSCGCVRASAR